jgi:hypothetical protein
VNESLLIKRSIGGYSESDISVEMYGTEPDTGTSDIGVKVVESDMGLICLPILDI